jgi:Ca2+-binding RTX toxin-like protein
MMIGLAEGITLNLAAVQTSGSANGYAVASGLGGADWVKGIENITGSSYADILTGNAGANTLSGGLGTDRLFGGIDRVRDTFDFDAILDSRVGTARDLINNFISGIDKIDLSGIDARTTLGGDQAFTFNGSTAKANAVWFQSANLDSNARTNEIVIYGDVTGDGRADFEIGLIGTSSVVAGDFIA